MSQLGDARRSTDARRMTRNHATAFAFVVALLISSAAAADSPDRRRELPIQVVDVAGTVDVTMRGVRRDVARDDVLELPSRIVTGDDGQLGLEQAGTSIAIAPDSDVEIPATAGSGQLIARLVQRRGNVFYDVAPRGLDKLRVE